MSKQALFLLNLDYNSGTVGGGSMQMQLTVNPASGALNGQAKGHIEEGTEHSPSFNATCAGHYHSTGLGSITKVGAVSGQAVVSVPPPAIGSFLSNFTASFAVDDEWNGKGSFTVDKQTYECKVSSAG